MAAGAAAAVLTSCTSATDGIPTAGETSQSTTTPSRTTSSPSVTTSQAPSSGPRPEFEAGQSYSLTFVDIDENRGDDGNLDESTTAITGIWGWEPQAEWSTDKKDWTVSLELGSGSVFNDWIMGGRLTYRDAADSIQGPVTGVLNGQPVEFSIVEGASEGEQVFEFSTSCNTLPNVEGQSVEQLERMPFFISFTTEKGVQITVDSSFDVSETYAPTPCIFNTGPAVPDNLSNPLTGIRPVNTGRSIEIGFF